MDFLDLSLLEKGGLLMWPLLVLSILGFVFFMERAFFLHKGQIRSDPFLDGIKNLVRKRRLLEALTVCEETPGPIVGVVKAALLNHGKSEEKMRTAIQESAIVTIPLLERRVGTIAAIAKVSPLVGLLGTVISILSAFNTISEKGSYSNAATFSGDIAQALITTATGLSIAIMAYLAHHFLHGRVRAIVNDMEYTGNAIMQFLLVDLPEEEAEQEKNENTDSADSSNESNTE